MLILPDVLYVQMDADSSRQFGEVVDVRFPSLKYNTHRRFCYVQFKSASEAQAATKLDGTTVGGDLQLVAKISDPSKKQERHGPVHEGREIHVSNLDWKASENDLKELFSKYGRVEVARIPTKVDGGSKGFGFVVFSSKVCQRLSTLRAFSNYPRPQHKRAYSLPYR